MQNASFLEFISSRSPTLEVPNRFVVSYLVNSCGFLPAAAVSTSKNVSFESSDRPDTILTLFRNHGFTETQILIFIRKCPSLLLANPSKTLLPKLEFFHSVGIQSSDLAKILSRDPSVLLSSLEKQITPAFNFFKSLVGTVENVAITLKRQARILKCDIHNVARNISILTQNGLFKSSILMLVTYYPKTVTSKNDRFVQMVDEIKQLGFDPLKCPFMIALQVFSSLNKLTWMQKLEAYGRWGLSEDEIFSAFRRYPWFMMLSENKITTQMDFFVNKMGWELAYIMRNPQIFAFSLVKRIIPRCTVLQILQLKGLVEKDHSILSVLQKRDESFLEKYVSKYEKEVPQLMDVFKGKIGLQGLGYVLEKVERSYCENIQNLKMIQQSSLAVDIST